MFYYINTFFTYSILGFLLESACFLITGNRGSSGILYGPWTPVYGIGVLVILLLSKLILRNKKIPRLEKAIYIFLSVSIVLSLIEWLGGMLIEFFFHTIFWDYRSHRYHLGKYVALDMSCLWGLLSLFFVYVIHPKMEKWIQKIPYSVTCLLVTLFMIDVICTLIFNFQA